MTSRCFLRFGSLLLFLVCSTRALAQDCYDSSIVSPSPFMGNNEEIFKLADGSVWEVKYEYEYLYEYYPSVVICPDVEKLIVGGKSLNVQLVVEASTNKKGEGWEVFEETNLQGNISGMVQQGRIFKTTSGSVYEVVGITLQLVLELEPARLRRSGPVLFDAVGHGDKGDRIRSSGSEITRRP